MSKHYQQRKEAASAVKKFYTLLNQAQQANANSNTRAQPEQSAKYDLLLKRLEELERNYNFHRAVLHNLSSGIIIINNEGTIIYANRSALQMLDMELISLQNKSIKFLFADQKQGEQFLKKLFSEKKQLKSEETFFKGNNRKIFPIGLTTSPFHDLKDRKAYGFIVHFRDISAQLEQRRQLERMERLALLGELAAGIAHEIRNPLASIKSAAQVLEESFRPDDFRSQLVSRIIKAIDRSNDLLGRFFDFTRPRKPVQEFHDVEMLIDGIYLLLAPRFKKKKINFLKNSQYEVPQIFVDPGQIEQVFMNLFLNAIEAMPNGGDLMVNISVVANSLNENKKENLRMVCVQITDSGVGIPEQNLEKIFNPFFTTKSSGIGLGLSISNRLIQENGGKIEVTSSVNKGTTFSLFFPIPEKERYESWSKEY